MFRLFLIISLLFTIGSCSNTRQDKNNLKISSLSNHLQKKGKSIILVMDFGDSDYQIIEYCDTILTYGIGYVKIANTISNNNIVWNSSYPLIRRKLAVTQLKNYILFICLSAVVFLLFVLFFPYISIIFTA